MLETTSPRAPEKGWKRINGKLWRCVFFLNKYLPKCYKITAGVGCVKSDYVEMISIFLFWNFNFWLAGTVKGFGVGTCGGGDSVTWGPCSRDFVVKIGSSFVAYGILENQGLRPDLYVCKTHKHTHTYIYNINNNNNDNNNNSNIYILLHYIIFILLAFSWWCWNRNVALRHADGDAGGGPAPGVRKKLWP